MPLSSSSTRYGAVSKTFHWLVALLILTAIPLGVIANGLPYDTQEQFEAKALLFSWHKTVGILAFLTGLARVVWEVTQPSPVSLHPDRRLESWLAGTVHWLLYGSLIIVPLSGWMHHAATEGFAPVFLPFGDTLPGVPKDPELAQFFGKVHFVVTKVLAVSLLLHLAGALKHHFVDRDATLRRMLPGGGEAGVADTPHGGPGPFVAALAIWIAAFGGATALALQDKGPAIPQLAAAPSDWQVEQGELALTITQLGSRVGGQFADWTAAITFDPTAPGPDMGAVEVTIAIGSLTLGSVTGQALGAEFFDATTFPTATFAGPILAGEAPGQFVVDGTLTMKDIAQPVTLPFELTIEGETAQMTATTQVQRLDWGIGRAYPDEGSVAFAVDIAVALTATRTP